ncbi:MAG: CotH kinase family protein [Spirochaetia bacterium]|nr:CotH kinase family protein [Spirochaetia bacterium]
MSKHKSWALIANYCDKTLLRNSLAYECGRKIMDGMAWNPDTRNVHLYLNGEYLGLYMVCESVKIDKKRVNIINIEDCNDASKAIEYGFVLEFNNRQDNWMDSAVSGL